ncbi:hypothetical protein [Parvicella tangerina]|uniref:Uncharacterized protein n=1 Tax=Parvicella tangerina TaxID=2829795 RepID=A0A916JPR3_9FLAO|nr:hypothetical protein [Parvicella tangerina]CAG5085846.1 hypothetical protein CRYO30217_02907 [Parvicella tangerina]
MKKKIIIIVIAVVVIAGGTVLALSLTGGGATEEDHAQGEETGQAVDEVLGDTENIEMEKSDIDDNSADSLENALGIDEEFDPTDI